MATVEELEQELSEQECKAARRKKIRTGFITAAGVLCVLVLNDMVVYNDHMHLVFRPNESWAAKFFDKYVRKIQQVTQSPKEYAQMLEKQQNVVKWELPENIPAYVYNCDIEAASGYEMNLKKGTPVYLVPSGSQDFEQMVIPSLIDEGTFISHNKYFACSVVLPIGSIDDIQKQAELSRAGQHKDAGNNQPQGSKDKTSGSTKKITFTTLDMNGYQPNRPALSVRVAGAAGSSFFANRCC